MLRKHINIKYHNGQNVSMNLNKFQDLLNQLTIVKLALDDEMQALILLSSLPDSWEILIASLRNSGLGKNLSLAFIKDNIVDEES